MKDNTNKLLCNAPYTSMLVDQRNGIFPCCEFDKSKFGNKFKSIDEYLHSQELLAIKEELNSGVWPAGCHICKHRREIGVGNLADSFNHKLKEDEIELNQISSPIYLDIRPGSKCNLKCRMCFTSASNLINEEFKKFPEMQQWQDIMNNDNFNSQQVIDFIKNNNIHTLKILGGEPTIDSKVFDLLSKINKSDNIEHLRLTTNATNLNKRFKKFFNNFNQVQIHFSVDAISDTYNYIRTNSNFKKVEKNIINTMTEFPSFEYNFNVVLTPYNVFNLKDLVLWLYELEYNGFLFNVGFLDSVADYTHISAVSDLHRESVIAEIEEIYLQDSGLDIRSLILQLRNTRFDQEKFKKFKQYNNSLDNIRKTNLIDLDQRFEYYT